MREKIECGGQGKKLKRINFSQPEVHPPRKGQVEKKPDEGLKREGGDFGTRKRKGRSKKR